MPGICTGCAAKFGLLKKELGCSSCGFSYCSKCLSHQMIIPHKDSTKFQPVCRKCCAPHSSAHSGGSFDRSAPVDGNNHHGNLSSGFDAPIHVKLPTTLHYSVAEKDKDIHERLERLKNERRLSSGNQGMSDEEIAKRLASLKDEDYSNKDTANNAYDFHKPDKRSAAQKSDDLLSQIRDEVRLDSKLVDPAVDIATRLAKLRGEEHVAEHVVVPAVEQTDTLADTDRKLTLKQDIDEVQALLDRAAQDAKKSISAMSKDSSLMDAYAAALKNKTNKTNESETMDSDSGEEDDVLQQVLDEAALEEKLKNLPSPVEDEEIPTESKHVRETRDELPWCSICNEDAVVRCIGCEGDLFCRRCFKEGHDNFDLEDHQTVPYKRSAA